MITILLTFANRAQQVYIFLIQLAILYVLILIIQLQHNMVFACHVPQIADSAQTKLIVHLVSLLISCIIIFVLLVAQLKLLNYLNYVWIVLHQTVFIATL